MWSIRKAEERGAADHGWLQARHTFSFASYIDPRHQGFRALRVMNEDRIQPGQGFGMHPHRDMEIVTYVLAGALEHQDSMGNGEVLRPGEFQRMSAGTGIRHSEFNPSPTEPTHLYQIWLHPSQTGLEPSYEQKRFSDEELTNQFRVVAASDRRDGALWIQQDAAIYLAKLTAGHAIEQRLDRDRHAWLQVLRGSVQLETSLPQGVVLNAGDGVAISEESDLKLVAQDAPAELMLFDLA